MSERYQIEYDGLRTRIVPTQDGEWARWNQARVAAIEHIEEVLADAQATLDTLRRSGCYHEYQLRLATSGAE